MKVGNRYTVNIKTPIDYIAMFATLITLMKKDLSQIELYCEIDRLVSGSPKKDDTGAVVRYLNDKYHGVQGIFPQNQRRIRVLHHAYASDLTVMVEAWAIGWT